MEVAKGTAKHESTAAAEVMRDGGKTHKNRKSGKTLTGKGHSSRFDFAMLGKNIKNLEVAATEIGGSLKDMEKSLIKIENVGAKIISSIRA